MRWICCKHAVILLVVVVVFFYFLFEKMHDRSLNNHSIHSISLSETTTTYCEDPKLFGGRKVSVNLVIVVLREGKVS